MDQHPGNEQSLPSWLQYGPNSQPQQPQPQPRPSEHAQPPQREQPSAPGQYQPNFAQPWPSPTDPAAQEPQQHSPVHEPPQGHTQEQQSPRHYAPEPQQEVQPQQPTEHTRTPESQQVPHTRQEFVPEYQDPNHSPQPTFNPQPQESPHVHTPPIQNQQPDQQVQLTPPTALDQSNLINPVKAPPKQGWRKFVYRITGGRINLGGSKQELSQERLLEAVRAPLHGDYRIAVMSLKGGVGKTTTTVALGGVFAKERGDRVIAVDANPDLGTLAQRVVAPGTATIRDLLNAEETKRYPQVRAFTDQAPSRLEVIGSERDPAVSEAFSEEDYRRAIEILQHHYNVILTDCGTGLMHSAMGGVLDLANTLVLVTSPALDGAQSASATLDWLNLHGYEQLAANAVVVVSTSAPGKPTVELNQLIEHFRARTRAVHVIPYDRHLAEGAAVDIDRLAKPTLQAYQELAATVAQDFGSRNNSHATY